MGKMLRRGNGEGSAYKHERDGVEYFVFEVSYVVPDTNKTKRKQFTSKKSGAEARRKADNFLKELSSGLLAVADNATFGEWVNIWLEQYKKNSVRATSCKTIKTTISYAVDVLGNVLLSRIKGVDIQRFLNDLLISGNKKTGDPLANSTVKYIRALLKDCFAMAVKYKYLQYNIMGETSGIRCETIVRRALTTDEMILLLNSAKGSDEQLYILIRVALETGFRRNELFGLHWDNVDFVKKTIELKQQLIYKKGGQEFRDLKTKNQHRAQSVSDEMITELRRYKATQAWQLNITGAVNKGLLFTNTKGNECITSDYLRRNFKPLLEKLNIKGVTFHSLRHTHATILGQAGVSMKIIQERLGHATIKQTADTYSHVTEVMQEDTAKKLNNIFSNM